MAKSITIEQFHATIVVPKDLRESEYGAIRRTLVRASFRGRLQRAATTVLRQYRSLSQVKVIVSW
jgi:hypothetical protein